MVWARRSKCRIAAVWLLCQAATFAVVPALLDASLAECVCAHGADATCPMHHKTAAGSKVCVMQSATTDVPATLNLLFSVTGLVPAAQLDLVPVHAADAIVFEHSVLRYRSSPPDSPPPRA
jgi:hypothetical protein